MERVNTGLGLALATDLRVGGAVTGAWRKVGTAWSASFWSDEPGLGGEEREGEGEGEREGEGEGEFRAGDWVSGDGASPAFDFRENTGNGELRTGFAYTASFAWFLDKMIG